MIEQAGDRLFITVPMTMACSAALLRAGEAHLNGGTTCFDLSRVERADSSAVALMLGWLRTAAASRSTVTFSQIPQGVDALAELYGVAELLPRA